MPCGSPNISVLFNSALEEEARRKEFDKVAGKDAAIERTFEWVHTQVSTGIMQEAAANQREERVSSGESQLPYLDKRVLEGGRAQLVVSRLLLEFPGDISSTFASPL